MHKFHLGTVGSYHDRKFVALSGYFKEHLSRGKNSPSSADTNACELDHWSKVVRGQLRGFKEPVTERTVSFNNQLSGK